MVLATVEMAIYSGFQFSLKSMRYAKAKTNAVGLANEKMEDLRNLPYDSLSTQNGFIYPHGAIPDEVVILKSGIRFDIHTDIRYIDDPFDGVSPVDLYPFDYKKVEIKITEVGKTQKLAQLSTIVSSKAAETASNTGVIRICVVDASGNSLAGASITIDNTDLTPNIHIAGVVDNTGCVMVPSLPLDSHNNYHLTATKTGYSTTMTYPRTAQNPNALLPDVNVNLQEVTSQTLVIDRLSLMKITVKDSVGNPVSGENFHLEGTKEIYNNPPTLKYSQDLTTDINGFKELTGMEFDSYNFTFSGWDIASISPYQPIGLAGGVELDVLVILTHNASDLKIISMVPPFGITSNITNVQISGDNFLNGLTMKIIKDNVEILGSVVSVEDNLIDGHFNLNGAAVGLWDLEITNPNGDKILQKNGFEVKGS